MSVPNWILFEGDLISTNQSPVQNIRQDGQGNIVAHFQDGSAEAYPYGANQQSQFAAITTAVAAVNPEPLSITSISPDPFTVASSTVLTMTGTGFNPSTAGTLFVDDASGGVDMDGYFYTCTYVDAHTMKLVYGGPGNGILPDGGVLLTYKDTGGNVSNSLTGTVASLVVTI